MTMYLFVQIMLCFQMRLSSSSKLTFKFIYKVLLYLIFNSYSSFVEGNFWLNVNNKTNLSIHLLDWLNKRFNTDFSLISHKTYKQVTVASRRRGRGMSAGGWLHNRPGESAARAGAGRGRRWADLSRMSGENLDRKIRIGSFSPGWAIRSLTQGLGKTIYEQQIRIVFLSRLSGCLATVNIR